jgi:hypothetical protein
MVILNGFSLTVGMMIGGRSPIRLHYRVSLCCGVKRKHGNQTLLVRIGARRYWVTDRGGMC